MQLTQRFETLERIREKVREEHGEAARIIGIEKVAKRGLRGRIEYYDATIEVPDPMPSPAADPVSVADRVGIAALLAEADGADEASLDSGPNPAETAAEFDALIRRLTEQTVGGAAGASGSAGSVGSVGSVGGGAGASGASAAAAAAAERTGRGTGGSAGRGLDEESSRVESSRVEEEAARIASERIGAERREAERTEAERAAQAERLAEARAADVHPAAFEFPQLRDETPATHAEDDDESAAASTAAPVPASAARAVAPIEHEPVSASAHAGRASGADVSRGGDPASGPRVGGEAGQLILIVGYPETVAQGATALLEGLRTQLRPAGRVTAPGVPGVVDRRTAIAARWNAVNADAIAAVALGLEPGDDVGALVRELAPDQVWAHVPAGARVEDVESLLAPVRAVVPVTGLSVFDAARTRDPRALDALGIPVVYVDGRPTD